MVANKAKLQAHQVNAIFQLFTTDLSGGIDKNVYSDLMNTLHAFPLLKNKIQNFAQGFYCPPFWTKMQAQEQT